MTYNQISDVLNNTIVPAILGEGATISPTLDNISDLGTAISDMSKDKFKDYMNQFVAGVARTYVDTRDYKPLSIPIRRTTQEYGGVVQSVKSDFIESRDSILYSLEDGKTYNDVNTYFGTSFDNKVYEKDFGRGYAVSIPRKMWSKTFTSAQGVSDLVTLVEQIIQRSMARDENSLERTALCTLIKNATTTAAGASRTLKLVTAYNAWLGQDTASDTGEIIGYAGTQGEADVDVVGTKALAPVTTANCMKSEHFRRWAARTIKLVLDNARYASKKYNDGTINSWLTDSVKVFNTEFLAFLEEDGNKIDGAVSVPFWNNNPTALIPTLAETTKVIYNTGVAVEDGDPWVVDDLQVSENKTISNVVGVVFDRDAVGYNVTPIPPETTWHAQGRFYTVFYDNNNRAFVDTRNTAIVFTLD